MNTQIQYLIGAKDKVLAEQDKLFTELNTNLKTPEQTEELLWKLFDSGTRYNQLCEAIHIATVRLDRRFYLPFRN